MIFKTYRELVNYILETYPYEKILTYCKDLNYKWLFLDNRSAEIKDIRLPSKLDIKKALVCALSQFLNLKTGFKELSSNDDKKIIKIFLNYSVPGYFKIHTGNNGKNLVIAFKYEYFGRFRKYSLPYVNSRYGNPRTKVVYRFTEEIFE